MSNLKMSIDAGIVAVGKASADFKVQLAVLCADLLRYVPDTGDIGTVNRLIDVLNKGDKAMVTEYFRALLPWKYEVGTGHFTSKSSNLPRVNLMFVNITTHLESGGTLWDYAKPKATAKPEKSLIEQRQDAAAKLTRAVERAMSSKLSDGTTPNKAKLSVKLAIDAILSADHGITLEDIMAYVNKAAEVKAKEQAALEAKAAKEQKKAA